MISAMLDALAMPGDYTRGLLSGKLGERVSGSELLGNYGMNIENPMLRTLADFGVGLATDPLTYLLPGAAGMATKAAKGFLNPGVAKLLPLRRQMTMVKGIGPAGANMSDDLVRGGGLAGRPVGGIPSDTAGYVNRMKQLDDGVAQFGDFMTQKRAKGMYSPRNKAGFIGPDPKDMTPRQLLRHETSHGLADLGLSGPHKWVQSMNQSSNPMVQGMGLIGDEMMANALQRGGWRGVGDAMGFLMKPKKLYGDILRDEIGSPMMAALYMNAPRIALGTGLGAGAMGGIGMAAMGD